SADGGIWAATLGGCLSHIQNGAVKTITTADGLSSNFLKSVIEDRTGVVWIGTDGAGLNRMENGKMQVFTTADGLSSNSLRQIFLDSRGNLWIGTDNGLNLYRDALPSARARSSLRLTRKIPRSQLIQRFPIVSPTTPRTMLSYKP